MKVKNKPKKKKLQSLPKIRHRMLKLWSEAVRERDGHICCYCGVAHMSISVTTSSQIKINAHHLLQKEIKDCPLKFCINNGIGVCPSCHKFNGEHSAHKSPIVFYEWFRAKYPERYEYILKNSAIRIDLDNRKVLEEIESRLLSKEPLDLNKLKEIEQANPREQKVSPEEVKDNYLDLG